MAEDKSHTAQQQRVSLSEKLWLAYFTSYVYEQGLLTEAERNRILLKIENRKGSTYRKEQSGP